MITRAQAEAAWSAYRDSMNITYEMRNPHFEMISGNDIGGEMFPLEDDMHIGIEEVSWVCRYERKYKSTGNVWSWHAAKCYIVEAKPGPYVIE